MRSTYILFALFFCFVTSCEISPEKSIVYNDQIGKSIVLDYDSLKLINNFSDSSYKQKWKTLTVLQMGCPNCIEEVNKLNNLFLNEEKLNQIALVIILTGDFSDYSYYHLVENNTYNFPIFWDKNNHFIESNKIGYLEHEKSLLINNTGEIKLIGSPIQNNEAQKKYIKCIQRSMN